MKAKRNGGPDCQKLWVGFSNTRRMKEGSRADLRTTGVGEKLQEAEGGTRSEQAKNRRIPGQFSIFNDETQPLRAMGKWARSSTGRAGKVKHPPPPGKKASQLPQ